MSNPFYGNQAYCCDTNQAYMGPSGHEYCAKCPCVPSCDLPCPPSVYPNGMNSAAFRDTYGYKNNPALMNLPEAQNGSSSCSANCASLCKNSSNPSECQSNCVKSCNDNVSNCQTMCKSVCKGNNACYQKCMYACKGKIGGGGIPALQTGQKNNTKMMWNVGIILLAIAIIYGIYYVYKKNKK